MMGLLVASACQNPVIPFLRGKNAAGVTDTSAGPPTGVISLTFASVSDSPNLPTRQASPKKAVEPTVARTVVPDFSAQVDTYQVTLTSNDGYATKSATVAAPATSTSIADVEVGSWDVSVVAKKGGTAVGAGSAASQKVSAGKTLRVSLPLSFSQSSGGKGAMSLAISFPKTTRIDYVGGTIDGRSSVASALTSSGSSATTTFEETGLSSGVHVLVMTFKRGGAGGSVAGVFRESVNIWDGLTSDKWVDSSGKLQSVRAFTASEFYDSNDSLADLALSVGSITFSSDATSYDAGSVRTSNLTITPTQSVSGQYIEYRVNGGSWTEIRSGTSSPSIDLQSGPNTLEVIVIAPDRQSTATYSVAITYDSSPTPQATTLVINEVANPWYINGPAAVELYNESKAPVNLANYSLRTSSRTDDGRSYSDAGARIFALPSLTVPAGGFAVVRSKGLFDVGSGGSTLYIDDGEGHYPWYSAYSGFVELLDSSQTHTVDFVRWGRDTTSPISLDFTFHGSATAFPEGPSYIGYGLSRDASGTDTYSATDWTMRAWSTLGGPNDVTSDADTDGDGIPDSAETPGGTFAGLPLYQWGARVGQKDIFIHIDYMDSTDPGIIPQEKALDRVKEVFKKHGYFVHFDVGNLFSNTPGDTENYDLDGLSHRVPYRQSVSFGSHTGYGNVLQYRVDYMPIAKQRVFFYMLFGSSQNPDGSGGSGGVAYVSGNVALVTLGGWGLSTATTADSNELINFQAESVMHEFGHNLGLLHGGDENTNYKPNYFSIMNYLYSYTGLPTVGSDDDTRYYAQWYAQHGYPSNSPHLSRIYWSNWVAPPTEDPEDVGMDFSDGTGGDIVEAHVNDTLGIKRSGARPIDFAMIGSTTTTDHAVDILNEMSGATSDVSTTVLHDFDDWSAINLVFQRNWVAFSTRSLPQGAAAPSPELRSMRMIFNNPSPVLSGPCAPEPKAMR